MSDLRNSMVDGFYAAYLTGREGHGLAMLVLQDGQVVGSDLAGTTYTGKYQAVDGSNSIQIAAHVKLPPNITLVQGGMTPAEGDSYDIEVVLAIRDETSFTRMETPRGPLNIRLVKINSIN